MYHKVHVNQFGAEMTSFRGTARIARVQFLETKKGPYLQVILRSNKRINFVQKQMVKTIEKFGLDAAELFDIVTLAALKIGESWILKKDARLYRRLLRELVSAASPRLRHEVPIEVCFYTGADHDLVVTFESGAKLRLREGLILNVLQSGVLTDKQLLQVKELTFSWLMQRKVGDSYEVAFGMFQEFDLTCNNIKSAC